jgi:glycosyltransferase involved in cell wall biosynthesis
MTGPSLSVLMPVKNPHPVYFPAAVRAILAQTYQDFELIVSEAPGTSSAKELLKSFSDPRIVHESLAPGSLLVDQRNHGFDRARAKLVALADADDLCHATRFEKQVAFLKAHPEIDVVSCQLEVIDAQGRRLGYRTYPTDHEALYRCMPRFNPIAQPGVTCRRDTVTAVGGYQYRRFSVNSDYELWSRLMKRGAKFAVHPEALVSYRIHPGAIKASKLRDVLRATVDIKKTYWAEEMSLLARCRASAEHGMQFLPGRVVLGLFKMLELTRTRS